MSSGKQIEANRRNGKLSAGPRTFEGKLIASKNATKHGLFSQDVLLPCEDSQAVADLGQRLKEELHPDGELELVLVERIVGLMWRLRRLGKIEVGILSWQYYGILAERAAKNAAKHTRTVSAIDQLTTFQERTEVLNSKGHDQARSEQNGHELERESENSTYGEAFVRDSRRENAFSKLSRYETSMERSLFRALHELQRLQAARQGKEVAVPLAVDIDVSGLKDH